MSLVPLRLYAQSNFQYYRLLVPLRVWKLSTGRLYPWMHPIRTKGYVSCRSYVFSTLESPSGTQENIWPRSSLTLASAIAALEISGDERSTLEGSSLFLCCFSDCFYSLGDFFDNSYYLAHHVLSRSLQLIHYHILLVLTVF